jgi:FSR family fosmidomycin resistance protein-like MFS transporter
VLIELALYPAFLLVPGMGLKVAILSLLGLFNAGWYAILQGRLYTAMPGRSGTVMTLGNLSGLIGASLPILIGWVAQRYNLSVAMWLILLAPVVLLVGLPGRGMQADRSST